MSREEELVLALAAAVGVLAGQAVAHAFQAGDACGEESGGAFGSGDTSALTVTEELSKETRLALVALAALRALVAVGRARQAESAGRVDVEAGITGGLAGRCLAY